LSPFGCRENALGTGSVSFKRWKCK